jgi:hypothetical protein
MVVNRVDGATGAEAEGGPDRQAGDGLAPEDRPGTEGALSRADSRMAALAANERPAPASAPESETADLGRGEAPQPYAKRLDTPIADDQPTPREVLDRFEPGKAGLPEVTEQEATEYIAQNAARHPWLACAKDSDPAVQRILASMDQGQGHALERHEGFADDDKLQRRVTALEDPAQLDPAKRVAGIDGCKPGDRKHACAGVATAIQDPDAFATAFARGVEHPDVQDALRAPFEPQVRPPHVSLPLEEVLGAGGHESCSGYQLAPVEGSLDKARRNRTAWVNAQADQETGPAAPRCVSVDSFEGATIEFFFRATRARDGYEVATMYVEPRPARSQEGDHA